jgi:hypothetical protein
MVFQPQQKRENAVYLYSTGQVLVHLRGRKAQLFAAVEEAAAGPDLDAEYGECVGCLGELGAAGANMRCVLVCNKSTVNYVMFATTRYGHVV